MYKVWLLIIYVILAYSSQPNTLFNEHDKVIVYNAENFKGDMYSGAKAHLLLLYSSWCGHCQRFAPTYIEFAERIHTWFDMVAVTGIDCVHETALCRNFSVRGYPTLRFIGPTTNITDQGLTYEGDRSLNDLGNWTIDQLTNVQSPPETWPDLHEVTEIEAALFKSSTANVTRPRVIIITMDSYIAREVILNLQEFNVRYTISESSAAIILEYKEIATGLVVISSSGRVSHISNVKPTVAGIERTIRSLLNLDSKEDESEEVMGEKKKKKTLKYVDTELQYKLYEVDLQSAVNNAFYTEVSLKTEFTPTDLANLKSFVHVVHRCGSWTPKYRQQLARVKRELAEKDSLTTAGWAGILEAAGEHDFPANSTFIGCEGSKPTTRGYSCSLWLLFHTMLSSCFEVQPSPLEVTKAIHGYIYSFFTCKHCRKHFLEMAERMKLTEQSDDRKAILRFWEAHNKVNDRLSLIEHDPYFPKVQFPPRSICEECSDANGQFSEDDVFKFLLVHYRKVLTPYGKLRIGGRYRPGRKGKKGKKGKD